MCDGKDEPLTSDIEKPSKSHKKKRKRKSHEQAVRDSDSEAYECKMTVSSAEEEMKLMNLSDESTLKSESKEMKKKKKKKKNRQDEKTPLKDSVTVSDDAGAGDDQDHMNFPEQRKKKKRNKQHVDDPVITTETASSDDLQFEKSTDGDHFSAAQDFDSDYFHSSCNSAEEHRISHEITVTVEGEALSNLSSMEEEEQSRYEETIGKLEKTTTESVDQKVTGGEETIQLMPLGLERKSTSSMVKEKKTVRRQLPEWITDADIIPDDIIEQSR